MLATTHQLEGLIKLDEKGLSEQEQAIYLWYKGFKTGARTGYEEIGQKYGISPEEVAKIVVRVERICTS